MKDMQYRLECLKHQLEEKKRRGVKEVVRKLNPYEREYIIEELHYEVVPYLLYRIRTLKLENYSTETSSLLRELHRAKKNGKGDIIRKLSVKEMKVLDEEGIPYDPVQYKINLLKKAI